LVRRRVQPSVVRLLCLTLTAIKRRCSRSRGARIPLTGRCLRAYIGSSLDTHLGAGVTPQ
jgi:hypothetical protein